MGMTPEDLYCGTCCHYQPTRNPDTGRVLPSQAGKCVYPVEWPELPICFSHWDRSWRPPSRFEVWSHTAAEKCVFWQDKEAVRRKLRQDPPKQEELPL